MLAPFTITLLGFYKVIEEYRASIRQLAPAKDKRSNLAALCAQFRSFLEGACLFYHGLIEKIKTKFDLTDAPVADSSMLSFL